MSRSRVPTSPGNRRVGRERVVNGGTTGVARRHVCTETTYRATRGVQMLRRATTRRRRPTRATKTPGYKRTTTPVAIRGPPAPSRMEERWPAGLTRTNRVADRRRTANGGSIRVTGKLSRSVVSRVRTPRSRASVRPSRRRTVTNGRTSRRARRRTAHGSSRAVVPGRPGPSPSRIVCRAGAAGVMQTVRPTTCVRPCGSTRATTVAAWPAAARRNDAFPRPF